MWKWGLSKGQARQGRIGRRARVQPPLLRSRRHTCLRWPPPRSRFSRPPCRPQPRSNMISLVSVCVSVCVRARMGRPARRKEEEGKEGPPLLHKKTASESDKRRRCRTHPQQSKPPIYSLGIHTHTHTQHTQGLRASRGIDRLHQIESIDCEKLTGLSRPGIIIGSHTTHFIIRSAAG